MFSGRAQSWWCTLLFGGDCRMPQFDPAVLGSTTSMSVHLSRLGSFGPATVVEELIRADADVGPDVRRDCGEIFFHSNLPRIAGLCDSSGWLHVSDESGTPEVYVSGSTGAMEKHRLSTAEGFAPIFLKILRTGAGGPWRQTARPLLIRPNGLNLEARPRSHSSRRCDKTEGPERKE